MRFPLLLRAAAIAVLALVILVPIQLIRGKVLERQRAAEGVTTQFAAETTGPQVFAGPFLAITCEESWEEDRVVLRSGKGETVKERRTGECPTQYFVPRHLEATAKLPVESLHRGIYPIRQYRAQLGVKGTFEWPAPPEATQTVRRVWKQAYLVSHVRDPRGLKSLGARTGESMLAGQGVPGVEGYTLREIVGGVEARKPGDPIAFDYAVTLQGTSRLEVAPVGDTSTIRIESNWPHPSFTQGWSPDERDITATGFLATWKISSLAAGGDAKWRRIAASGQVASTHGAGVALVDPINPYSLADRATQYAFLFVLFTFAAFALTEVAAGIRLHPVQYGLVGAAIAVFFLLLLALSEHVAFGVAYGVAATACVSLIAFYLRHPLGSAARALGCFGLFATMYASLYVLLRSEDHALLLGSTLVFALLATVMVVTRRVDWAQVTARMASPAPRAG